MCGGGGKCDQERRSEIFIPVCLRSSGTCCLSLPFCPQSTIKVALVTPTPDNNSSPIPGHSYCIASTSPYKPLEPSAKSLPVSSRGGGHLPFGRGLSHQVNMTPAQPQPANRPRLVLRSDSFTHEDLNAAFAASASQPRTKDLKIRIAQKDETPAPPPSPTEAFSSHRP